MKNGFHFTQIRNHKMSYFHDSVEWKQQLNSIVQKVVPNEPIPYSVFQDFLEFFNTPIRSWKIPMAGDSDEKKDSTSSESVEITSLTEQVVLEEIRHYLWGHFYNRLLQLDYERGEVFHIVHDSLRYPEFKDTDINLEDFPAHTLIFEACGTEKMKLIRIWSVILPNLPRYTFDDGESFTQYYEYAKLHVPQLDTVQNEEDLYQIIVAERQRHDNKPYATVAGQRDKDPGSILYFYWATEFFFSCELFWEKGETPPSLHYNPHLFPYPIQYVRGRNFRKFRYLLTEP